jgi:hypothetical protein
MNGRDSVQSLLLLRKLTRAVTEAVRVQMIGSLATLTPLLKPTTVLGDYVQGGQKELTRKAEKAFKQLQALYEVVASAKPFNLQRELSPPLSFAAESLEITPFDYSHPTDAGDGRSRQILVRAPMTWTLTYSGFGPTRLQELLNTRLRPADELQRFVLSYLVLHVVLANQPGVAQLLEGLRFPVQTLKLPEFGELPITRIGPPISTTRPSDAVIVESAELTGMDAFEEVLKVEDLSTLKDPLKDRLLEIAQQHLPQSIAP